MKPPQSLPWQDPLDLAAAVGDDCWVLLYSGVQAGYSGRYSLLAYDLAEHVSGKDFSALEGKLSGDQPRFGNAWFGYLGYGLKDALETLTPDKPHWLALPNLQMMRFNTILEFDHEQRVIQLFSTHDSPALPSGGHARPIELPAISSLQSNMDRKSYLEKAAAIIERIHNGDLYQANLTRKFEGYFEQEPIAFDVFRKLVQKSPAPYSAFLKLGATAILSSSPELFLNVTPQGQLRTRPIKGTSPRYSNAAQDRQSFDALSRSAKDRAENLMIVDLMRNDLSRSCIPGSVQVASLFDVTSHTAVHHMSSTITGTRRPGTSTLEAIQCCFPPGSMTGAPKIRAMNLCSELEELERGVYAGAIGWLGGDGSCELSVVIRTLLLQGNRFEFQVGGGIVADSSPEAELMEIIDKSKGILSCLGISPEEMYL
jgi:aminodeoxychorismate synthase component I